MCADICGPLGIERISFWYSRVDPSFEGDPVAVPRSLGDSDFGLLGCPVTHVELGPVGHVYVRRHRLENSVAWKDQLGGYRLLAGSGVIARGYWA